MKATCGLLSLYYHYNMCSGDKVPLVKFYRICNSLVSKCGFLPAVGPEVVIHSNTLCRMIRRNLNVGLQYVPLVKFKWICNPLVSKCGFVIHSNTFCRIISRNLNVGFSLRSVRR